MRNYIRADLLRISRRVPRIVVMLIVLAIFALAVYIYTSVTNVLYSPEITEVLAGEEFQGLGLNIDAEAYNKSESVKSAISHVAGYTFGIFGLLELIFVFSDDFKAKTAQIAIGVGINRLKVIFSKLIEVLILLVSDLIALGALSLLLGSALGLELSSATVGYIVRKMLMGMVIENFAYTCLVSILLFATQSMIVSILGYLALTFHIVSGAIGLTSHIEALADLNLGNYTLTTMLERVNEMMFGGGADYIAILAVVAYIVASVAIANFIYSRRELEF